MFVCVSDQRSRAEEDHENDEGLEPAVFYDLVTRLPRPPPDLTESRRRVQVTALETSRTHCGRETERQITRAGPFQPDYQSVLTIGVGGGRHARGKMGGASVGFSNSGEQTPGAADRASNPQVAAKTGAKTWDI